MLEQAILLTLPQLAETVGVEYRTLHSWLQRGLVEPSLQRSRGTGSPNLFSRQDAVKVKVIAELRQAGVTFDLLIQASESLAGHPGALTDGAMVLVNGSVTIGSEQEVLATIADEAPTLVYNTRRAIAAVEKSLVSASEQTT